MGSHPGSVIQKRIDARFDELMWLSDDDVKQKKAIEENTLLEYYYILNKKVADAKNLAAKNKSRKMNK